MKTTTQPLKAPVRTLIAAAVAAVVLAACASTPPPNEGVVAVRAKFTALQADPNLSGRAPAAIHEADEAVRLAETPVDDKAVTDYRVYVADRKVETARALAETRLAEDQRTALLAQAQNARLDARTREAELAKAQANNAKAMAVDAQANANQQAMEAARAREQADAARAAADEARQQALDLQTQINTLQAKVTDRGIVLTLGDVLFATGQSDLKPGGTAALDRLVAFLNKYPDRSVAIDGYTDSVGSDDYNQALSERRANAVRSYVARQGIEGSRLTATGRGKSSPVADNSSATGRQQNRRVEVIISNTVASAAN